MSIFVVLALAWLALAVLGWSWLAAAARGDRAQARRQLEPSQRPRVVTRARTREPV